MKASIVSILKDFAKLFFPDYCLGCTGLLVKGEEILCTSCIFSLPKTNYSIDEENPITEKFIGRLPVKYAWAYLKFRKTGIVQHVLHQLKYNNHPEIGIRLGMLIGKQILERELHNSFDMIVPMPLHETRLRKRGYNQSTKIAEGISQLIGLNILPDVIIRKQNTVTQTKKTKTERWQNVENAFEIKNPLQIIGKRILLVDDVITTGASLETCGQKFIDHGCKELSIVCVAEAI